MDKAGFKGVFSGSAAQEHAIDWELRPGGMVVQKRDPDAVAVVQGPMIKVKVSHGLFSHDVTIPAQATFGPFSTSGSPPPRLQLASLLSPRQLRGHSFPACCPCALFVFCLRFLVAHLLHFLVCSQLTAGISTVHVVDRVRFGG